jgi:hypothetical protein
VIPANIASELTFLQQQTAAAAPITSASPATIAAIKLNAAQLVSDLDTAVTAAAGSLDTWAAPADPDAIAQGIEGLVCSASEQSTLVLMRGVVGRAAANLSQLP